MDKRDFEKVEVKKGTTLRVLTVQRETAAAAMREGKKEVPRIVFVSCCLLFRLRQERRFESKIDSYMWFARRHLFPATPTNTSDVETRDWKRNSDLGGELFIHFHVGIVCKKWKRQ